MADPTIRWRLQATDQVSSTLNKIDGRLGRLSGTFKALGGIAIGAGLARGLQQVARAALQFGDRMDDMSRRTGISAESLQALDYAASQTGSSLDAFVTAMSRLARANDDALNGSTAAAEAFRRLGIDAAELTKLPLEERMYRVADALAGLGDVGTHTALGQRLLGRQFVQLLPLFSQGADGIRKLSAEFRGLLPLTNEQVRALGDANDAWDSFYTLVSNVGRSATAEFAPAMEAVAKALISVVRNSTAVTSSTGILESLFKRLAAAGYLAVEAFDAIGESLGAVAATLAAIGAREFKRAAAIVEDYGERIAERAQRAGENIRKILDATQDATGTIQVPTVVVSGGDDAIKALQDQRRRMKKEVGLTADEIGAAWAKVVRAAEAATDTEIKAPDVDAALAAMDRLRRAADQAMQLQVEPPDVRRVLDAYTQIKTAAEQAGTVSVRSLDDITVPAPDVDQAIAAMARLRRSADQAMQLSITPPEISSVLAAYAQIKEAAEQAGNVQVQAPDISKVIRAQDEIERSARAVGDITIPAPDLSQVLAAYDVLAKAPSSVPVAPPDTSAAVAGWAGLGNAAREARDVETHQAARSIRVPTPELDEAIAAWNRLIAASKAASAEAARDAERIFSETRLPIENYRVEIESLQTLFDEGLVSSDTMTRRIEQLGVALGEQTQALADSTNVGQQWNRDQQDAAEIADSTVSSFDRLAERYRRIAELQGKGLLSSDTADAARKAAVEDHIGQIDRMATATSERTDSLLESIRNATEGLASDITDVFFDTTQSIGDMFTNLFDRIAREMVTKNIVQPLIDLATGALGDIFSGGSLSEIDMSTLPRRRAHGGPVMAGQSYLVGESGPELFMPRRSGQIVPNDQLAAGAGMAINFTINSLDPRTAAAVIAENERTITNVIRRSYRRAGRRMDV